MHRLLHSCLLVRNPNPSTDPSLVISLQAALTLACLLQAALTLALTLACLLQAGQAFDVLHTMREMGD